MLFADSSAKAELNQAPQFSGGNIRAARIVAEILGEFFFLAVWRRQPRLNGYPRRGKPLNQLP